VYVVWSLVGDIEPTSPAGAELVAGMTANSWTVHSDGSSGTGLLNAIVVSAGCCD